MVDMHHVDRQGDLQWLFIHTYIFDGHERSIMVDVYKGVGRRKLF